MISMDVMQAKTWGFAGMLKAKSMQQEQKAAPAQRPAESAASPSPIVLASSSSPSGDPSSAPSQAGSSPPKPGQLSRLRDQLVAAIGRKQGGGSPVVGPQTNCDETPVVQMRQRCRTHVVLSTPRVAPSTMEHSHSGERRPSSFNPHFH